MKIARSIALIAALVMGLAYAGLAADTPTTLITLANAGTQVKDQSKAPNSGVDRRGYFMVHYEVPAAGITGVVDIAINDMPKGMILQEGGMIEVSTAILPAAGTAALKVGGITVLDAGSLLETAGIVPLTVGNLPAITTADDKLSLTIAGTTATSGVFTVYLPVIAGNAQ
jgi:hypothetical protein